MLVPREERKLAQMEDELLNPCSVEPVILPMMISPLKGRKTMSRNLTKEPSILLHKGVSRDLKTSTIDINEAITMANEPIGRL